jgi:quercetin dioxygenase-like cupin family protein
VAAFLSVLAGAALAADPVADDQSVKWQPAPPVFPAGAQFAVVSGDPGKSGLYVVRLKVPAGYAFPAHNHPTSEYVTVLSGDFHVGMGDKLDRSKAMALGSGGFVEAPAKMNHFAWSDSGSVLQVHGEGPFEMTYVDPAEDPRQKK